MHHSLRIQYLKLYLLMIILQYWLIISSNLRFIYLSYQILLSFLYIYQYTFPFSRRHTLLRLIRIILRKLLLKLLLCFYNRIHIFLQ